MMRKDEFLLFLLCSLPGFNHDLAKGASDGVMTSAATTTVPSSTIRVDSTAQAPPPDPVANLTVRSLNTSSVFVQWQASGRADYFNVTWQATFKDTTLNTKNETKENTTLTGLHPGDEYRISVYAVIEDRKSSAKMQSIRLRPDPVSDISFTNVTTRNLTVSWSAPAGHVTNYSLSQPGYICPDSEQDNSTSRSLCGLFPGSQVNVSITSISGNVTGAAVGSSTFTVPLAPECEVIEKNQTSLTVKVFVNRTRSDAEGISISFNGSVTRHVGQGPHAKILTGLEYGTNYSVTAWAFQLEERQSINCTVYSTTEDSCFTRNCHIGFCDPGPPGNTSSTCNCPPYAYGTSCETYLVLEQPPKNDLEDQQAEFTCRLVDYSPESHRRVHFQFNHTIDPSRVTITGENGSMCNETLKSCWAKMKVHSLNVADAGVISCNATYGNETLHRDVNYEVLARPVIKGSITDREVYLALGYERNFTCTASITLNGHPNENATVDLEWLADDQLIYPQEQEKGDVMEDMSIYTRSIAQERSSAGPQIGNRCEKEFLLTNQTINGRDTTQTLTFCMKGKNSTRITCQAKNSDRPESLKRVDVSVHYDWCVDKPCQNGGTCNLDGESFSCSCTSGYTGRYCNETSSTTPIVSTTPPTPQSTHATSATSQVTTGASPATTASSHATTDTSHDTTLTYSTAPGQCGHCKNGATCDEPSGTCFCRKGFFGRYCGGEVRIKKDTKEEESLEGLSFTFRCVYQVPDSSRDKFRDVEFTWYSQGVRLTNTPKYNIVALDGTKSERCERGRKLNCSQMSICGEEAEPNCSQLTIRQLRADDSGSIECLVRLNEEEGATAEETFSVLPQPAVRVYPAAVSVDIGEPLIMICKAYIRMTNHKWENETVVFRWYKEDQKMREGDTDVIWSMTSAGNIHKSNLTIKAVQTSTTYRCTATNNAGNRSASCEVHTIPVGDDLKQACDAQMMDGISWKRTLRGTEAKEPCPEGQIGVATRQCRYDQNLGAVWEQPSLVDCRDKDFQKAIDEADKIADGSGATDDARIEFVTESIMNMTMADMSAGGGMKPGNLKAAAESLQKIALARLVYNRARVTPRETQSVATAIGTMLDERNQVSWVQVQKDDREQGARVIGTADAYGMMFSRSIPNGQNRTIPTNNLVMQVKAADKPQLISLPLTDSNFPSWAKDQVLLSQDLIQEISAISDEGPSDQFRVSIASNIYKTAQFVFPLTSGDIAKISRVDKVMSLSFGELANQSELHNPLQLTFSHKWWDNESSACGFWDFETGNWSTYGCTMNMTQTGENGQTVCICNHTTNFAVLISAKPILNNAALNLVSTIGCALSMAAMLLTVVIYLLLWKMVKSHTAVLLINLCLALTIANAFFLFGIQRAVGIEIACKIVGVCLHYFFLAAFCIMLAEGVYCLLNVMAVFHQWRRRETTSLVVVAWVIPAVITGATYGISRGAAYSTEKYCWLSTERGYLYAFVGPILGIIFVNIIVFFVVLKKALSISVNDNKKKKARATLWNIGVLTPMLGLSWAFGLLTAMDNQDANLVFQWLFSIINSLQGVFIFVFHCFFNIKVRNGIKSKFSSSGSSTISNRPKRRKKPTKSTDESLTWDSRESSQSFPLAERRGLLEINPRQRLHRREKYDPSTSSGGFSDIMAATSMAKQETEWKKLMRSRAPSFELDSTQEVQLHRRKVLEDHRPRNEPVLPYIADNFILKARPTDLGVADFNDLADIQETSSHSSSQDDKRKSEEEKFVDSSFAFLSQENFERSRSDRSSTMSEHSRLNSSSTDSDADRSYSGYNPNKESYHVPHALLYRPGSVKLPGDDLGMKAPGIGVGIGLHSEGIRVGEHWEASNYGYQQDEYF